MSLRTSKGEGRTMRRRAHLAAAIFLGTMAMGAIGPQCSDPPCLDLSGELLDDCQSDGTAGGPPDPPPNCVPGEGEGWKADALCGGIFVRLDGDDENAGTPDAPVKSLGKAIALATALPDATKKNVYACAETFEEKVEIKANVTLFGGLDCENGWRWVGEQKRTTLTAEAGTIPLTMHGGGSVRMEDVHVLAESVLTSGASSIAAVADGVTVSLARCTIEASDAAPGADQSQDSNSATRGDDGNPGEAGCMAAVTNGGAEQPNDCEDGVEDSLGGAGGVGQTSNGGNGGDGLPDGPANGGPGQTSGGTSCMNGRDGDPGASGDPGAGAAALGTLSQDGYIGEAGEIGRSGTTARGGGGGGGARGVPTSPTAPPRSCPDPNAKGVGGASGGSGGAGGCGGKGGLGGGAGGASIALISLDSTLQLHDVTLKTGSGGKGGNGALGQPGGAGGTGGMGGKALSGGSASGLDNACNGGRGGQGGQGGRGGGGRGGHSIGIAFRDKPPPMGANRLHFELGEPGLGGEGDGTSGDGTPGAKAPTLDFASP
ncbi:hypothetical protein WMF11_08975 [Sorangium sp. So ce295]|uniref:hypothetical protein n=1 Tax=Sorangium sp. So ce295 TaxID=3133295 RepID=UPI003F5DA067